STSAGGFSSAGGGSGLTVQAAFSSASRGGAASSAGSGGGDGRGATTADWPRLLGAGSMGAPLGSRKKRQPISRNEPRSPPPTSNPIFCFSERPVFSAFFFLFFGRGRGPGARSESGSSLRSGGTGIDFRTSSFAPQSGHLVIPPATF